MTQKKSPACESGARESVTKNHKPLFAPTGKRELLRRLQRRDIIKVLKDRYHARGFYEVPDDDAGRGDLWPLMANTALARSPEARMQNVLELWAPWMIETGESAAFIEDIRTRAASDLAMDPREVGRRLGVSRELWERLGLRFIKPVDMTDEEIAD